MTDLTDPTALTALTGPTAPWTDDRTPRSEWQR
ncbi:hypothetical protein FHS36_002492 [Streptomyces eurocidicus]|uniref:Uncharacterized protein n=1 Tax=Streptomyces eurocidicus TaxID=66423 RepID=A0A7W8F2J0_STREU|nr:hypothetical protein [Streptomyces eurocidicus]